MLAQRWHPWFAWHRVRIGGLWVWWTRVERRGCEDMGGTWTDYRHTPGKEKSVGQDRQGAAEGPKLDSDEKPTVLAALRYYELQGMGEPDNRDDEIHRLATDRDRQISLDESGIRRLFNKVRTIF